MSARTTTTSFDNVEYMRSLIGHNDYSSINAIKFTPDGSYCMTASDDRTIKLWNPHVDDPSKLQYGNNALLIKTYAGIHGYGILDVSITKNNERFASCGVDKTCYLWDVANDRVIRRMQGHTQRINSCDINDEGSILMTASYDKTVCIWDLRSQNREPMQILSDFKDSVTCVVHSRVSTGMITATCIDGYIRTYDLRKGCLHSDYLNDSITSIKYNYDEKCVLATCIGGKIQLLELSSGRIVQSYVGHVNTSYKLESVISSDQKHVISGSEDGQLYVWNIITGKVVSHHQAHTRSLSALASSPINNIILSASYGDHAKCFKTHLS